MNTVLECNFCSYFSVDPQGSPSIPNPASILTLSEYNFGHPRRGKAVVINQKDFHPRTNQSNREGTDVDAEAVTNVFMDLGFDVDRYDNLTSTDFSITMRKSKIIVNQFDMAAVKFNVFKVLIIRCCF